MSGCKDSSQFLPDQREAKCFDHCLERIKQAYSRKYNLDGTNVYEKVFSSLNGRIKKEIENSVDKSNQNCESKTMFKVANYGVLYRKSSQELLKILKKTSADKVRKSNLKKNLLDQVYGMDLDKVARRTRKVSGELNVLPKVYDFNENLMLEINQRKSMKVINNQVQTLRRQLVSNQPKEIQLHLQEPSRQYGSGKVFKRNAFLASLNYCLDNPII